MKTVDCPLRTQRRRTTRAACRTKRGARQGAAGPGPTAPRSAPTREPLEPCPGSIAGEALSCWDHPRRRLLQEWFVWFVTNAGNSSSEHQLLQEGAHEARHSHRSRRDRRASSRPAGKPPGAASRCVLARGCQRSGESSALGRGPATGIPLVVSAPSRGVRRGGRQLAGPLRAHGQFENHGASPQGCRRRCAGQPRKDVRGQYLP